MKKYIILLIAISITGCVSSSKYQQLFDEHQVVIAKNKKNIEDLERAINYFGKDIATKKNEINNLNYYLKQANDKNILNEETIKKLNEELQTKNNELQTLNEKINSNNLNLNETNMEENEEEKNDNFWEQTNIHKNYLKGLVGLNNAKLHEIAASNLGLDFYWDYYGNNFISDINNKDKSLNELRKIADQKRRENISLNKTINLTISNLRDNESNWNSNNKKGMFYISNILTSFAKGNTNLQVQLDIAMNYSYEEIHETNGENRLYINSIFSSNVINIENNTIYQLFVDAEKLNNITYVDITIEVKKNIKKSHSYDMKDVFNIKIKKIYFVYPAEIKTLEL